MAPVGMILSAGFGTRLAPLTTMRPKPLMEIGARPILYYLIRMLEQAQVNDIIINLHYLPEHIEAFIKEHQFKARLYLVREEHILGTAGGVKHALSKTHLKPSAMVIMHGDILCDVDLTTCFTSDFSTLLCESNRLIKEYQGSVAMDNHGRITRLGKFYQSDSPIHQQGFFTGIQYLSKAAVDALASSSEESLVADIYPKWLRQDFKVKALMQHFIYEDLGSLERIFSANMNILAQPQRFMHIDFLQDMIEYAPNIYGKKNVVIDKNVTLHGPVLLGDNVHIKKGAIIGPYVALGRECIVEENAVIKHSVIMSHTVVQKMADLDCILMVNSARVKVRDFFKGEL